MADERDGGMHRLFLLFLSSANCDISDSNVNAMFRSSASDFVNDMVCNAVAIETCMSWKLPPDCCVRKKNGLVFSQKQSLNTKNNRNSFSRSKI